ncbi:DUF3224 domain-containing protein [Psychrosphaera aestuarii]|uniref:DUF3224 domain-containing protein n=1 Tax=Psychrosphaera aestuarii TaxID=1266052 RepID=UPI001B33D5F8|nr:DUF3224 domain-containing protein [Psychrosphaera aestuarii]
MTAKGNFEIDLKPAQDEQNPAGRMLINKVYSGDLQGKGSGQMLSKRTESGASAYSAIEEFQGNIGGKTGGFTLVHNGYMTPSEQKLEIIVLSGSGTGELAGITGTMDIIQTNGGHHYVLSYELPRT